MAHPFSAQRQSNVERSRVGHITRAYAAGGGVSEVNAGNAVTGNAPAVEKRADGGPVKARLDRPGRARGGRAPKKKGGNTHVNILIGGGQHPPAGGLPPPVPPATGALPPPRPPAMVPPPPPPGGPMAGAPMPPPGMPPGVRRLGGPTGYKRGGKVDATSQSTPVKHRNEKAEEQENLNRGKVVTYRRGGRISSENGAMAPKLPGGAGGGKARLAKQARARSRYAKV